MNDTKQQRVLGLHNFETARAKQAQDAWAAEQEANWPQCPTCKIPLDRKCEVKRLEGHSYQYVCGKCEFKEEEFLAVEVK